MTAQQFAVGLTSKKRLGTYGDLAFVAIGLAAAIYVIAKFTGLIR